MAVALLVGCAADDDAGPSPSSTTAPSTSGTTGEAAVWYLDPDDRPDRSATSFIALVSRLACNDGETGVVLPPAIEESEDEVVVTFTVEPTPPGDHTCPGNASVPQVVALAEPIGRRGLVDGACHAPDPAPGPRCEEAGTRLPQTIP